MPQSALLYALRILKIRPNSIAEIRAKLKRKGYDQDEADEVVKKLITQGLLDDRVFANAWIRYRLARPFGFGKIKQELKEKGIAPELLAECLESAQEQVDVKAVIQELALAKNARMGQVEIKKRKKRIFDFLVRRGYPIGDVYEVVGKLC